MALKDKEDVLEGKNTPTYAADWDSYMSNVDDVIGSFLMDLGWKDIAPVADKPNFAWVEIHMRNPREDGLSSEEESELLYAIEDNVVEDVTNKHNAVYVGRLTSDGKRELYFYFSDTDDCEKTVVHAMSKYPTYEFDFGSKEDKAWDVYLDFLYPSPRQYQVITNDRVLRHLEQHGDTLTKERMVEHWIYFETENDMKNYISEIEKQHFTVINSERREDKIYALHVGRVDKVDYQSVHEYVLYLWELAGEHNGDYDGWECTVEKE
jgi:uncharacterized protein (TIGR01619 family)